MKPLRSTDVLRAHPRERTDHLRRALRENAIDQARLREDLPEWLRLFREDSQPGLRALLLLMLREIRSDETDEMLRRGRRDRGDGVRLEAYRTLLERESSEELVRAALKDRSVELCLLGAHYAFLEDPARAVREVLALCRDELGGPREEHALRRCTEVLAEDFADPRALPGLRELTCEIEDEEGHLEWAIQILQELDNPSRFEESQ